MPAAPSPLIAAIFSLTSQAVALVVGFGIVDNTKAGLIVAVTVAAVNVAVLALAAVHSHSVALVRAAGIHASPAAARIHAARLQRGQV